VSGNLFTEVEQSQLRLVIKRLRQSISRFSHEDHEFIKQIVNDVALATAYSITVSEGYEYGHLWGDDDIEWWQERTAVKQVFKWIDGSEALPE
jgi:hypothetical protein